MVTRKDYTREAVNSCLSVMVEIMTVLGEYRDHIVLVGGWIPYFLLPEHKNEHTGSMDIDLALDHRNISNQGHRTILQLLKNHGYRQSKEQPFIFLREIGIGNQGTITVEVDLLSGEYGGTAQGRRTQRIQNLLARKIRGGDLAFRDYLSTEISVTMPDGAQNAVTIKVANVVPFIIMKGMALWNSPKEKHPWDIYFMIRHYPGGIDQLVERFTPYIDNRLVREGLGKIRSKFETIDSIGPVWTANFEALTSNQEWELTRRDSFERVNTFLDRLGIEPYNANEETVT